MLPGKVLNPLNQPPNASSKGTAGSIWLINHQGIMGSHVDPCGLLEIGFCWLTTKTCGSMVGLGPKTESCLRPKGVTG